ncbi:ectoine/hydroxyectoine ABC transporter permease subunit EhuC [Xylanibacillus composti]|uniref:Ectoine/hydroxyectoine ABC transporter permease subunit EhuC n=2 Tax=Xylanibacillus composti TaxID=1572762 RepID=A0A8J4H115_9BACL|nr:ectoine/hydroxyectoine ABC transporter permease subunit EhuC [Xylanibacillus composti]MDT9726554.1 ectoine/hydroxyectoine ABC transporter permease subunit EhuC [Xylanibacillus composti]GIQ68972.1 ectoine/hydroxyectoine ABC transporter permease subunit EhuC [Xylanibacillus composti]
MIEKGIPFVFNGTWMTIKVLAVSTILSYIFAMLLGLARVSRNKLINGTSYVIVEFFRGTSLVVQLFWIYYCVPVLFGLDLNAFYAAVIALGINYGSYGSEIVRSAILTVPKGQTEASIALNFTPYQRMRHIIIPQALLRMLPPFGNLQVEMLKGTALVYFIGLEDIFYRLTAIQNNYLKDIWLMYVFILVLYFVMAWLLIQGYRFLERRLSVGRV